MESINDIANVLIKIIRAFVVLRVVWCLIILMFKNGENNTSLIGRMKYTIIAWIIAESTKQLISIIQNYYKG